MLGRYRIDDDHAIKNVGGILRDCSGAWYYCEDGEISLKIFLVYICPIP